jgi:hypothetical protein
VAPSSRLGMTTMHPREHGGGCSSFPEQGGAGVVVESVVGKAEGFSRGRVARHRGDDFTRKFGRANPRCFPSPAPNETRPSPERPKRSPFDCAQVPPRYSAFFLSS